MNRYIAVLTLLFCCQLCAIFAARYDDDDDDDDDDDNDFDVEDDIANGRPTVSTCHFACVTKRHRDWSHPCL